MKKFTYVFLILMLTACATSTAPDPTYTVLPSQDTPVHRLDTPTPPSEPNTVSEDEINGCQAVFDFADILSDVELENTFDPPPGYDGFTEMVISDNGEIYIANPHNNHVIKLIPTNTNAFRGEIIELPEIQMIFPVWDIALDNGNLLVVNTNIQDDPHEFILEIFEYNGESTQKIFTVSKYILNGNVVPVIEIKLFVVEPHEYMLIDQYGNIYSIVKNSDVAELDQISTISEIAQTYFLIPQNGSLGNEGNLYFYWQENGLIYIRNFLGGDISGEEIRLENNGLNFIFAVDDKNRGYSIDWSTQEIIQFDISTDTAISRVSDSRLESPVLLAISNTYEVFAINRNSTLLLKCTFD